MVAMGVIRTWEQGPAHRLSNPKEAKAELGPQIPALTVLGDWGDSVALSEPLIFICLPLEKGWVD